MKLVGERYNMKINTVILDWAGTTVDFGCFAPVRAFLEAFRKFGIEPTIDEIRKPMGMLKREHIKCMMQMPRISSEWQRVHGKEWTEEDVDQVYEVSENSIIEILNDYADVKPYVKEVISELRSSGYKIGSTTGYTDEMMHIVSNKAKENGYEPDCWFSPTSVGNYGRPYPYMIFKNMQKLNVKSVEEIIKVGDTVSDIIEAKNAGIVSVGIVEGSSIMALSENEFMELSEEEKELKRNEVKKIFMESGADYTIDNMKELPALLGQLNNKE